MLDDIPEEHLEMVKFYTEYWNTNKDLIVNGRFTPYKPLTNYPIQKVENESKTIIGLHDDMVVTINSAAKNLDIFKC